MSVRAKRVAQRKRDRAKLIARIGWTRSDWINEAQAVLGRALIVWFEIRLAERNRYKRFVFGWKMEFERLLACGLIDLSVHPVRREFDRAVALDGAINGMDATAASLRQYIEGRFKQTHGPVRKGLDDRDIEEFWKKVGEAARVVR